MQADAHSGAPTMPGPGEPIPVPPYFPVQWRDPAEAQFFWQHDRMHFPHPLTPMTESLFVEHFYNGFNAAAAAYEFPIRMRPRVVNGYAFHAVVPIVPPEQMEAQGEKTEQAVSDPMARQREIWDTERLPEINRILNEWDSFDLRGASLDDLRAHLERTITNGDRIWEIHFLTVFVAYLPISLFEEMYRDLFGEETAFDAYRLVQGFDNLTLQTARVLWGLSREALQIPEVRRVLETESAANVIPALEQTQDGRAFLEKFRAYLKEYGRRSKELIELSDPSWIEEPSTAIKNLKDYAGQPDRDLMAEADALAREREAGIAESRRKLESYPDAVRGEFEFLLRCAQEGNVLTEDHTFYLDFAAMYYVRQVLVECGRRLHDAGVLESADDVFFLTIDETRDALAGNQATDIRRLVAARREALAQQRGIHPPPVLGSMPPGPPPQDPMTTALLKFFGGPPQMPREPDSVQGTPGSPGIVRGPARVIGALAEADRLQQGDVLVAETTAPPWTPLFATVAAVVTDTGGILSHSAVVAREYGIPAVVGTTVGTVVIHDGDTIEVDGNTGTVRIIRA
jgi:phosphohistidine swiveling domain-containing protein